MKIFRLKHKPTGLYYKPNNGKYASTKSNLSKRGKLYIKKQSYRVLFGSPSYASYYHPTGKKYPEKFFETKPFIENEWEWEEVNDI